MNLTPIEARLDLETAKDREKLFSDRLAVAEEQVRIRDMGGHPGGTYDPLYYYCRMLRAQRDFAWVQSRRASELRCASDPQDQARADPPAGPEQPDQGCD